MGRTSAIEGSEMHRVGVIPFDTRESAVAVLFVTSQTRGRWILPKGMKKPQETHVQASHRAGSEEAGVKGDVLVAFPMHVLVTNSVAARCAGKECVGPVRSRG